MLHKLSLINHLELKNVERLTYHYPSMPLLRYQKLAKEYHQKLAIKAAEDAAKANNCFLLPVSCIHYKRRDPSKRIVINGKSYYLMHVDDITQLEIEKLKAVCAVSEGEKEIAV